jgi:hypothetical protein
VVADTLKQQVAVHKPNPRCNWHIDPELVGDLRTLYDVMPHAYTTFGAFVRAILVTFINSEGGGDAV